jgi:hypothetical protein
MDPLGYRFLYPGPGFCSLALSSWPGFGVPRPSEEPVHPFWFGALPLVFSFWFGAGAFPWFMATPPLCSRFGLGLGRSPWGVPPIVGLGPLSPVLVSGFEWGLSAGRGGAGRSPLVLVLVLVVYGLWSVFFLPLLTLLHFPFFPWGPPPTPLYTILYPGREGGSPYKGFPIFILGSGFG